MSFEELMQSLLVSDTNSIGLIEISLALVLPFFLTCPVVWVYRRIQKNNNFSSSFILSMFLFAVLSSEVTLLIGNNIARAFGLVGALSLIRFRSAIKDPLDAVFIFWALTIGLACGTSFYAIGVLSVLVCSMMLLGLKWVGVDRPRFLDSVLKVVVDRDAQGVDAQIESSLKTKFHEVSKVNEYFDSSVAAKTMVYTLKRKGREDPRVFEEQMKQIDGVKEIHHLNQESSLFLDSRH